jgi:hypothetical protein
LLIKCSLYDFCSVICISNTFTWPYTPMDILVLMLPVGWGGSYHTLYTIYTIYKMHGKYIKIVKLLFYKNININSFWSTSAISSVLTSISVF